MRVGVFVVAVVAALLISSTGFAAPLSNQFVPVGVINTNAVGTDAFGVAYDPINDLIWSRGGGSTSIHGFTPFKNLVIGSLPIDAVTGLPMLGVGTGDITLTPFATSSIQALGFDAASGQLVMHRSSTDVMAFDPFTGANLNLFAPLPPIGTSFLDGLDVEGGDMYSSSEPVTTGGDSLKNGAIFLNNANPAQTDLTGVWTGPGAPTITRWAGIEAVTGLGTVYAVAETGSGAGRTVATYDLAGMFIAVDPDGSPFAQRLEDLAFDGRYLYGASLGDRRIFVFDIVGPGGTAPEPGLVVLLGAGLAVIAWRRRKNRAS